MGLHRNEIVELSYEYDETTKMIASIKKRMEKRENMRIVIGLDDYYISYDEVTAMMGISEKRLKEIEDILKKEGIEI